MEGDPGEAGSKVKLTLGADIVEMAYKLVLTQPRDHVSVQECWRSRWMVGEDRGEGLKTGRTHSPSWKMSYTTQLLPPQHPLPASGLGW